MLISDKTFYRGEQNEEIVNSIDKGILRYLTANSILLYYRDFVRDIETMRVRPNGDQQGILDSRSDKSDVLGTLKKLIHTYVHTEDRNRLLESIEPDSLKRALSDKGSVITYYRRRHADEYIYARFGIFKIGEEKEPVERIVIAATDVDEVVRDELKLKDEASRYKSGVYALSKEYSSVYYVDLDTNELVTYNISNRIENKFGDSFYRLDYSTACESYIQSAVCPEHKNMMRRILSAEYIRQSLEDTDVFTRIYLNDDEEYCEMKCVRIDKGDDSHVVVMGFAVKDAQIRHEIEESRRKDFMVTLLDGLSREYHTVWLLRSNHELELYRTTGASTRMEAVEMADGIKYYDTAMSRYIEEYVAPEDREDVRCKTDFETVRSKVPETGLYTVTYKRISTDGGFQYHQACFGKAGHESDDNFDIIVGFRDVDSLIREELDKQAAYHQAVHDRDIDSLTGIRNRYSYDRCLEEYAADCSSNRITCIYIDADGLHELNNREGHDAGDEMLRFMAARIMELWGTENTFRTGGDEFMVFLFDHDDELLEKELLTLHNELERQGYSASTGFYTDEMDDLDIEAFIKIAETKMSAAKRRHYSGENDRRQRAEN